MDGATETGGTKATGGSGGSNVSGHSGGGADAGPMCSAPPKAPDADLGVMGTCTAPTSCGGSLTGTWILKSLCMSTLFTGVRSLCSTAQISVTDHSASGGVAFHGTNVSTSLHAKATANVTFPNNCTQCRCSDLESKLGSAGLIANCSPVCSSGNCTCTVRSSADVEGTHPFTTSGNTFTTDPSLSFDYCISDATLTLVDSTSRSGFQSATFGPGTPSPEVCDGRDNDLNGVIDDNPVECPTCSDVGVCAEGFSAKCGGNAGWQCTYTSPKYEATEKSCDRLDNDCNGVVDKLTTCEICDGMDNDKDGVVDNNLTDTPTCPKTGVCASGTSSKCAGADGWQCQGTADTYELVETKCDGLDNDCDGAKDEACPACSGMMDMWMAGTTGMLDLYRGAPTAMSGQKILSTTGRASKLVADPTASKIYWVNAAEQPPVIQRANFDGSDVETLAATTATGMSPGIGGLAIDPGKTLYWFDFRAGVLRAPLASLATAGSAQPILTGVSSSELAVAAGKLYYNDALKPSLYRSDLDGKNPERLVNAPVDEFVVDLIGNHIYWLRWFDFASLNIWSTNLDGSGQKSVAQGSQFTDDFNLSDFAVDPWQKTILVASSTYIQQVTIGSTARASLVQWSSNLGAIALSGCAP
jgi:hypothetical protein